MEKIEKRYYDNGKLKEKIYFKDGVLHNENRPAWIWYYENGNIESEYYYINDMLHREDGPAMIFYNINGTISNMFYYINHEEYNDKIKYMLEVSKFK